MTVEDVRSFSKKLTISDNLIDEALNYITTRKLLDERDFYPLLYLRNKLKKFD